MKLSIIGKSSTPKPPIRIIVMSVWEMDEGSCRQDYSIRRTTTRYECAALLEATPDSLYLFFPFFSFYLFPPLSAPSSPVESEDRMGSIGGGAEDCRTVGLARLRPRGSWKRFAPFGAGLRPSARFGLQWVGHEENPVLTNGNYHSRCFCLLPCFEEFF
ncbi:hypothetical protein B9Z19DRAFT_1091803 [Tuber borchii]|uniref:Uncharacterized protein n=1 Tax=Tuber borchii TaxID=42251 RepID=A0A2T6ZH59_TUBBO|nr:hypothetical protein B9Z19DRAFT_1091803 [Tuber borchii]